MNSKKNLFNNSDFSSNNKNKKDENNKSRYEFKYKNHINNNLNKTQAQIPLNINTNEKEGKNLIILKEKEEDYTFETYKDSISKKSFLLFDQGDTYKYQTISVVNSFKNKIKEIFNFEKKRSYKNKTNINQIELSSELNLSFDVNNCNKNIGKTFNKNNLNLINIIRIFDKCHKQINKINQKSYQYKNNHYYIYKNRINNYNYLKFKKVSKFSKNEKHSTLKNNFNSIKETHIKTSSELVEESKNGKKRSVDIKINNKTLLNRENIRYIINLKKVNDISKINDIKLNNKKISISIVTSPRNKINEAKILEEDNKINYSIKKEDFPIGLNKKNYLLDKQYDIIDSLENNNNRNSTNLSRRFFYKYRVINNIKAKTKSIFEENEKNNNNQSINVSMQIKDNIKNREISKVEVDKNKRIISKKIQRHEINKNSETNLTNILSIKKDTNQNNKTDKILNKTMGLSNQLKEEFSIYDNKDTQNSINMNKRKKNLYLNKNSNEYTKYYLEKNKYEDNKNQVNIGHSFIQSTSQRLLLEKNNNVDLTKSVNNLTKLKDSKNTIQNNIIRINDKNIINNKNSVFKSEKVNKNKNIFNNYDYKQINSQNSNNQSNKLLLNEQAKIENIKIDRFKRRIRILKGNEEDKNNNINNMQKSQDLSVLSNKNNIMIGNPFRDVSSNIYQSKRRSNRAVNHKFHEIKSTSCEKNNCKIQNHKEKNHISYKIENKAHNQLIASTSMRNINFINKINIIDKFDGNLTKKEINK